MRRILRRATSSADNAIHDAADMGSPQIECLPAFRKELVPLINGRHA